MNCFSFSIFGKKSLYFSGFLPSIIRAIRFLYGPSWQIRVYCDEAARNVPYYEKLLCLENIGMVKVSSIPSYPLGKSCLTRMMSIWEDYDVCLFRDLDYFPTYRERRMIQEFIDSDACFHACSDHECHTMPLMAGMIACKPKKFIEATGLNSWEQFVSFEKESFFDVEYLSDQIYLAKHIWPIIKKYTFEHRFAGINFNECLFSKNIISTDFSIRNFEEFVEDKNVCMGGYTLLTKEAESFYEALLDNDLKFLIKECQA